LTRESQQERRNHILDAAERCFARRGFHGATMQEICQEAGVSPGAIYLYFPAKEALIDGIVARDRAEMEARIASVGVAGDLMQGLAAVGRHYMVERPAHKAALMIEIGAEATRNEAVAALCRGVEQALVAALGSLFRTAKARGEIAADVDCTEIATMTAMLGDGLMWRRATDPSFDIERNLKAVLRLIAQMLRPIEPTPAPAARAGTNVLLETSHS
jgi:AcrR family transcriptional regulator